MMGEPQPQTPDPERQAQARRYARLRRKLIPVSLGLGLAWALGLLLSGATVDLRRALTDLTTNRALVITLFSGIVGGGYLLLELPLSIYSGYVLPHRFGLSTQSLGGWVLEREIAPGNVESAAILDDKGIPNAELVAIGFLFQSSLCGAENERSLGGSDQLQTGLGFSI